MGHWTYTFGVQGVHDKHCVGVACQRGSAIQRLNVKDTDSGRVGGQGEVSGGLWRSQQPQVCHLVVVADQLPRKGKPAFLLAALQGAQSVGYI